MITTPWILARMAVRLSDTVGAAGNFPHRIVAAVTIPEFPVVIVALLVALTAGMGLARLRPDTISTPNV